MWEQDVSQFELHFSSSLSYHLPSKPKSVSNWGTSSILCNAGPPPLLFAIAKQSTSDLGWPKKVVSRAPCRRWLCAARHFGESLHSGVLADNMNTDDTLYWTSRNRAK